MARTEYPCYIDVLRNHEKVDLLVVDLRARNGPRHQAGRGPSRASDVILNSDMHERSFEPIVATPTGTLIVEEGQDGTTLGELRTQGARRQAGQMEVAGRISSTTASRKTAASPPRWPRCASRS
ncbi:MAG: hypothetical protein MZV65_37055 [Chromatiales bacterium]|nr:hypothetical protein [Chromatiales bacterium]